MFKLVSMKCWTELSSDQLSKQRAEQLVIDELNTLAIPSCVLLSRLDDLRDGTVFCQMLLAAIKLQNAEGGGHQLRLVAGAEDAASRVRSVLIVCRKLVKDWPKALRSPDAAERIAAGDHVCTALLASVLFHCIDGSIQLNYHRGVRNPHPRPNQKCTATSVSAPWRNGVGDRKDCARKSGPPPAVGRSSSTSRTQSGLSARRLPPHAEAIHILSWIRKIFRRCSQGLHFATPAIISTVDDVAAAFSSGVLFCMLIERSASIP